MKKNVLKLEDIRQNLYSNFGLSIIANLWSSLLSQGAPTRHIESSLWSSLDSSLWSSLEEKRGQP
jgi:hypothetical protein